MDNHHYQLPGHSYECLAGCGVITSVKANAGNAFESLQTFLDRQNDWCFGHFGYDLKNETEQLTSAHENKIGFADLYFFVPQYVFQLSETTLRIGTLQDDHVAIYDAICNEKMEMAEKEAAIVFQERVSKADYINSINRIKEHILRGDCYELNYCMEFFAEQSMIDPLRVYQSLTAISPNPFSAFYKVDSSYLLCASPERFLRKQGTQLLSQPIKGTVKRNVDDAVADAVLKEQLHSSKKDRSENVMVVDLVRNDLSRVCKEGTVNVDELFEVYSFPQVHQMISSIVGEVKEELNFTDIIRATFPMGSMTGAPKRKVMELIGQYEQSRRGIFSGAVGYIAPDGDFDFNVVIRSILYNEASNYLSYMVGSGITFYSDAENEYEECLLKADAIRSVLS
ncbi:anthranilate synthase component I family protein [Lacibacter sp. H407]|uniref:anthranilate synthase component I family protein n=1 Tax=Lacibacter sp. H407 TaxID=3133423 RepID=UPI0030C0F390